MFLIVVEKTDRLINQPVCFYILGASFFMRKHVILLKVYPECH